MSYDLAVWSAPHNVSSEIVEKKYISFCERSLKSDGSPRISKDISAFFKRLQERYPSINDYPTSDLDICPWTSAFDISMDFAVMTIAWSRVDDVVPYVVTLAKKHKLLCYDPQSNSVL